MKNKYMNLNEFFTNSEIDEENDAFPFFPSVSKGRDGSVYEIHHFWLTREITEPWHYDKWFQICGDAEKEDLIFVHINSPGGNLDTALQIYDELCSSEAFVVAIIEGACCSGASMIALAADKIIVSQFAYMMIHSWSGGAAGKFSNVIENAEFQKKWFSKVMNSVYEEFCTSDEINAILAGKDLWLEADEVMQRFEKLEQFRIEQAKKNPSEKSEIKNKIEKMLKGKGLRIEDLI